MEQPGDPWPHRGASHGGAFYCLLYSLLRGPSLKGVFQSSSTVQVFHPPPPPTPIPNYDSSNNVTLFQDGLGSKFKDLQRAPYQALPDGLFIPHFLIHGFWSLYEHFLSCSWIQPSHWCHKEDMGATKGVMNSHTTAGSAGYTGADSTLIKVLARLFSVKRLVCFCPRGHGSLPYHVHDNLLV